MKINKIGCIIFLTILCFGFFSVKCAYALIIESFESGSLSLYTQQADALPVIEAVAAHDGSLGLTMNATNSSWIYRDDVAVQLNQGDIFSVWVRLKDVADGRAYAGFGASSLGTYSAVLAPNTGQLLIQLNSGYSYSDIGTASQTYLIDHWYRLETNWGVGGAIQTSLYDSDGTTLLNTVSAFDTTYSSGGIAFRGFYGDKHFDTYEVLNGDIPSIPEPATMSLLGLGLLGLAGFRRKRV